MDVSNVQHRPNIALEDFILWAKASDVGIQQSWKASLKDIINLLNVSIGSGTVVHPKGPLTEKKLVVGSGGSGLETTEITVEDIQNILKQRLTSVGGGVKFYDGIKDGVHSFRTIDGDAEKNILVALDGSGNRIVLNLNKDLLQNLHLPHNAIPLGNEKGDLRYLEKGADFTILQTLNGAVQWAPLKVGEVNTVENLGKGLPLFHTKAGEKLRFKTLSTNSPEIKISEKGGEIFLDYKAQHKLTSVSDEIKITPKDGELQLSFHTNPIKGFAELEVSTKPTSVPENKAHYTFLIDTNVLQDINPLVYTEYEGINDGAIVTFVNAGKKDMKFSVYTFVPHAYISFRWDAEGHSFNKI